jgi:hypothetical protein
MLTTREADLDARVFRQILEDIDDDIDCLEDEGKLIDRNDIARCLSSGTLIPVYDRESDMMATFTHYLEGYSREGEEPKVVTDVWCLFAEDISPEYDFDHFFVDPDEMPTDVANAIEEITSSVARVLASARLMEKLSPRRLGRLR